MKKRRERYDVVSKIGMVAVIMGAILAFGCLIQGNDYNEEEEE